MRFFIALEIPEENKGQFQTIQDSLHALIPQARLTAVDKIHLTLAFIGEQPDTLKNPLISTIQKAVLDIKPFEVTPAYIDGFPDIHHPQVLWVGVKGDIDKILLIHERMEDELKYLQLPIDERRFIPHVSIAKVNNLQIERPLEENLQKIMATNFQTIRIVSIKLFESLPYGGFHRHNTLAEVKLL